MVSKLTEVVGIQAQEKRREQEENRGWKRVYLAKRKSQRNLYKKDERQSDGPTTRRRSLSRILVRDLFM